MCLPKTLKQPNTKYLVPKSSAWSHILKTEKSKLAKPEMGGDTLGCIIENATAVDSVGDFIALVGCCNWNKDTIQGGSVLPWSY